MNTHPSLAGLVLGLMLMTQPGRAGEQILEFDPSLQTILSPAAEIKELARGFIWSEGPTWDKKRQALYFSDVPENKAYSWSPEHGLSLFLNP